MATEYTVEYQVFPQVCACLGAVARYYWLISEYHTAYHYLKKRSKFKVQFLLNAYCFHKIVKLRNH